MSGGPDSASFLHDYVVRAERLGFDSLWTWERLLRAVDPRTPYGGASSSYAATKEMPDTQKNVMAPTEVMAAMAAWTERARIGVAIMVMGFANPVALAKRLATVDVLSGGRLVAGLGLGWSEDEHIAGGVEYATRGARSEEFIEVLTKCWKEDPVTHAGRFFQVPSAFIGPKPIQQPRPPLVFGLWYGFGRLAEDLFRVDETHGTGLTGSQWTAVTVMVLCAYSLFVLKDTPWASGKGDQRLASSLKISRAKQAGVPIRLRNPCGTNHAQVIFKPVT